jgi:hypothetical protein
MQILIHNAVDANGAAYIKFKSGFTADRFICIGAQVAGTGRNSVGELLRAVQLH